MSKKPGFDSEKIPKTRFSKIEVVVAGIHIILYFRKIFLMRIIRS